MAEVTTSPPERPKPPAAKYIVELSEDEALELLGFLGRTTGPERFAGRLFDQLDLALADYRGDSFGARMSTEAFARGETNPTLGP